VTTAEAGPTKTGTAETGAGEPLARARERWGELSWTRALLAVTTAARAATEGPLAGLTFTVKDTFAAAGLPSTGGSLLLAGHVPERDATLIARLKAAGATLFAKANCAEFGNGIDTETRIGGRVLHPTDPAVSPGGSSGGDAVAVAGGIVDFAIGGDYGGSVRWPAQCTGVHGLRTSAGRIPRTGRMPSGGGTREHPFVGAPAPRGLLSRVEVPGIFARDPALIARVLNVIAGPDGDDWFGLTAPAPPARRTRRLAVTTGREAGPVSAESLDALTAARAAARRAGFEIVDADGVLADATAVYNTLRDDLDVLDDLRLLVGDDIDLVCPGTRAVLEAPPGRGWGHPSVREAWRYSREIVARVAAVLTDADALLVPVAPVSAVAHGAGVEVDGQFIQGPALMAQCRAISLTGLPALAMPTMATSGGRTTGVQVVGPPGGDELCCSVAAEIAAELSLRRSATVRSEGVL
jgi:amidase